jgi:hypothetical protein
MRIPALFTTLLLAACSAASPIPPAPGAVSGYFSVEVRGDSPVGGYAGGIWVELEEDSHVAVFRLMQDEGAVLVWPFTAESPRTLPAGSTMIPERTIEEERIARWRESHLFPPPARDPRSAQQQRSVLVVASSQPLQLEPYLSDHEALRRDMGGDFIDVTRGTGRILELLVDDQQRRNWAWVCTGTPIWCRGR